MRRLIRWSVALALIWSLLWGGMALVLRQAYLGWFDDRTAQGWSVDYAEFTLTGYPLHHRVRLTSPSFADPVNGTAWSGEWLQFESPAIWPGRQSMTVSPEPQRISYFDQTAILTAQDMQAEFHLAPGLDLQLKTLSMTSGPWQLENPDGSVTEAQGLTLSMSQQSDAPQSYDIRFDAPGFVPPSGLRSLSARAEALPDAFESLTLNATVTFDRPWDLRAVDTARPQPRAIQLDLAEAQWGKLLLRMAADLTVTAEGVPNGQVSIQAENWREAVAMGRDTDLLPPEVFDAVEQGLSLLAQMTGGPDSLDVRINLRDGFMAVGLIPIGPAPRLILR